MEIKKTKKISVRVSEEQLNQIDILAAIEGLTRSKTILEILFGKQI
jgi:predicted DNA binding CopG/RHH family protein